MGKTKKPPQQENISKPSAHDDAQVSSTQDNKNILLAKIAVSITGLLWFMFFAGLWLSLFKDYSSFGSGIWMALGIGILAVGIFLYGTHVLALSFKRKFRAVSARWHPVYTHLLFGMGTFNLGTKSKPRWISLFIAVFVPIVLILNWWRWYQTKEINWENILGIAIVMLVYLSSFGFLWAKDSENSKEKKKIILLALFSDKDTRDIIQTIGAIFGMCVVIVQSINFIIGLGLNNIAPTPISTYTPTILQTSILIVEPTATPETPMSSPTAILTDTPTITLTLKPIATPIFVRTKYLIKLRQGPHFDHPFATCLNGVMTDDEKVIVLGRNLDSKWFWVSTIYGCEGWLIEDWLDSKFLSDIPMAPNIPTDFPIIPTPKKPRDPTPTCDPFNPNC